MTGIELLKVKMLEMGCTKAQINSKVLPIVLSICADDENVLKYENIKNELPNLESKKESLTSQINSKQDYLEYLIKKQNALTNAILDAQAEVNNMNVAKGWYLKGKKIIEQIEEFEEKLKSGETAEGRDALRKAQLFIDTISVNTKYDNTAFIIGLSAILSGGDFAPIDKLKKINPELFIQEKNNIEKRFDLAADSQKNNKTHEETLKDIAAELIAEDKRKPRR